VLTAPGPGEVRLIQLGSEGDPLANGAERQPAPRRPSTSPAGKTEKQEPKLTHVKFSERMQAWNQRRMAIFYGDVHVVHVPSDDPYLKIDLNHPPEGYMYLHCQKLSVFSRLLPDGKTKSQEMEAHGKVDIEAKEFFGRAEVVKYDEAEDRVIFEGGEGGLATLYRVRARAEPPEPVSGKKITYWRKTGLFKVDDAHGLSVGN
jgi:hypothetical protein